MADLLCSQLAGQSLVLKRVSQAEPTNQHSPPSWCHFENTECNSKKTQEHSSTIRFKQPITDKKQSLFRVKRLIRCRSCCNNSGGVLWLAKQIPTHTLPEASLSLQTPTADTKQTTIAQLLCLNTTSLFSKTGQWTHTHIHTRSYCTHARTHTHVVWRIRFFYGGSDSGSRLDSPSTLTSRLLCCLWIYFSPQLNSLNSKSPHPSITSLPPCPQALHLPPANKGGQIQYGFNKEEEKKRRDGQKADTETRDRKIERKELRCLSHFFFSSFSSSIALRVSSCLACKSFSCEAGRPLLAALQLSTLLSPCKREKEGRTNIVTARRHCKVVDTDAL